MSKQKRKRNGSRHRKVFTILCDWCGERRECSREDVRTCGDRCRKRLANYTKRLGYKPDAIVGPYTVQDAIDKEVERLIRQERERRRAVAAELAQWVKRQPVAPGH